MKNVPNEDPVIRIHIYSIKINCYFETDKKYSK